MDMDVWVLSTTAACGVIGGLSIVGAARWPGPRAALWSQRLFIACLVILGACTLFAVGQERSYWILAATAFGALAVAATVDYSSAALESSSSGGIAPLADGTNQTNFAGARR